MKKIQKALNNLCRGYLEDLKEDVGFDTRQAQLFELKYIQQLPTVNAIANEMYISPETYHRIHKQVLTKVKSYITYLMSNNIVHPLFTTTLF